jgi:hypothetical protein
MDLNMNRARCVPLALLLAGLLFPMFASAGNETQVIPGWYARFPIGTGTSTNNTYLAIDAVDEQSIYFGGIVMPTDGNIGDLLKKTRGIAFRSWDAGESIQDISGDIGITMAGAIGGKSMCAMSDLKVWRTVGADDHETRVVWAACGDYLGRSSQGASFDATFDAPLVGTEKDTFTVMHIFDGSHGVVGATSGAIYLFELPADGKTVTFTPANIDNQPNSSHPEAAPEIDAMTFLSDKVGWAVASDSQSVTEQDYEGNETTTQSYYDTRVFKTTDGGKTWTLLSTIALPNEDPVHQVEMLGKMYPLSFDGGWYASRIQMVDADNGFLALVAYDNTKQLTVVAKLLRTIDGGKTWSDCMINMQIGSMPGMFSSTTTILLSEVGGMHFWRGQDGVIRGRVAGSSFLTEGQTSMGGNPPKYFTATMVGTSDGGATWNKIPELGTVSYDPMGGGTPSCKTARLMDVDFLSPYKGFGVGDEGTIFRFEYKCTTQSDCEYGYYCSAEAGTKLTCQSCETVDQTDHQGSIDKCADWNPPPETDTELAGRDVIDQDSNGQADAALLDGQGGADNGTGPDEKGSNGCQSSADPAGLPAILLLFFGAAAVFVARRRAASR